MMELVIVMAIIALLGALAGPSFSSLIKNTRIENKTNDLIIALKQTRANAVTFNNFSFLCRTTAVDPDNPTCPVGGTDNRDWGIGLMSYQAFQDTTIPSIPTNLAWPFGKYRIDNLEPDIDERRELVQATYETAESNLIIRSSRSIRTIVFRPSGLLLNNPIRIAVCDDRDDPELYGRIISINTSGQIRSYRTDASDNTNDCTPIL